MSRNRERARRLLQSVVASWIVVLGAGVAGLAIVQRRRRAAEAALRESERQLLQAQKMEAVGRLAGGIAHDINNYLAAITAQCERVKMKTAADDPTAARMEEAIETAFKASSLIRRLLAFSRRQPLRREVIDLNAVVADLEPMIHRLLGDDVRLATRLAPGLWSVEIDPAQLEQVIVNLLVNAREAMPGGGRVTIDTANLRSDAGGEGREMVVLAVADTGTGIPPEVRDKIFEPFFTTKEESGSSGLGLATVYGIVAQHGGRIRVDSEPGAGTEFTLYFPRSAKAAPPARAAERRTELPRGAEAVLLIEDNDDFRESARAILADLGYRVEAAAGGDEALAAFERAAGGFDLVISDVVMPDRSGPEIVDLLRERKPGLRVLFISGTSGNLILRHGLRRGEFDLLEKPFSLDALARTLREILDRAPA
jgi:signal transduction histidine kinase/CheY-like chemotaxis protein